MSEAKENKHSSLQVIIIGFILVVVLIVLGKSLDLKSLGAKLGVIEVNVDYPDVPSISEEQEQDSPTIPQPIKDKETEKPSTQLDSVTIRLNDFSYSKGDLQLIDHQNDIVNYTLIDRTSKSLTILIPKGSYRFKIITTTYDECSGVIRPNERTRYCG